MIEFFHAVLYVPIYNLLIFFADVLPGADLGLAVVLVTVAVRVIILPLSFSAQKTARAMKSIQPEMEEVRERLKDDKEAQMRETMAIYKKYGINPFASILTLLIQLPIVICLYWVFRSATLFTVDVGILYPFVTAPAGLSPLFLGMVSIAGSSIVLAALAALSQAAMAWYSIPMPPKASKGTQADFARAMTFQMRFAFPLILAVIAYTSGAIALYFITTGIFGIVQEFFVRRAKFSPPDATSAPV
jgi:YidC/Oxa1 family membrane protein insertase